MANKRFFWLKLKENFFNEKAIKKLRKIAGGDTYTIIYLKLLLKSMSKEGKLYFDGIEDTFCEEIALDIDEDADNVKMTVMYLQKCGLLQVDEQEQELELLKISEMVGSETNKAELMRQKRRKERLAQTKITTSSSNNVTQSSNNVTKTLPNVTKRYTDIDIDIDKEIDKDNNITRINTRNIIAQSDKKIITHEPKREKENIFIKIPLINGEEYPIGQELVEEYKKLYLNVDVEQELRKMKAWIISNPQKRKTKRGILRFVNNWLSKEQDKNFYSKNLGNKGKLNNRSPSYDIKTYENYSIFDQKTEDDDEWGVGDMNTVYKPKEGEDEYTEEEKRLLAKAWET